LRTIAPRFEDASDRVPGARYGGRSQPQVYCLTMTYRAVAFDLLTALLDSWSLWEEIAPGGGFAWRSRYLTLTYGAGRYVPYVQLVEQAAVDTGFGSASALIDRWDELTPWPETNGVVSAIASRVPVAVVTNCSTVLARGAVDRLGVEIPVVVTAEDVGWYKPDPHPYEESLTRLGLPASSVLFVAGSRSDIGGAADVGMDVFWHNRRGSDASGVVPDYEHRSLDPLIDLI
jgi:2-haloacid dehalogenase